MIFGSSTSIQIAIEWHNDVKSDGPLGKTWGNLQLWVADTLVWGSTGFPEKPVGITWSWIELFEFLANAWPYLENEEQHPINSLDDTNYLSELWERAQSRWESVPDDVADKEDELLRDFLAVHDLAEALQGAQPPQLLLLRQGERMIVSTFQKQWELPYKTVMSVLTEVCDFIADRISDLSDVRSTRVLKRWNQRNSLPYIKRLQIATGISEGELHRIWPTNINQTASNDERYELRAAARMLDRRVPESKIKEVLKLIYDLPKGRPLSLRPLQEMAENAIVKCGSTDPITQGYALAEMLREHLSQKEKQVNPESILNNWKIKIHQIHDDELTLDAIAVWADDRHPTILLNTKGPRARHRSGIRSTLAHEICHVLLDVNGALPAVEVLGGVIPRIIEQRANAFAAEFLLPRKIAAKKIKKELEFIYQEREKERAVDSAMVFLSNEFSASHETIAWQIINSGCIAENEKLVNYIRSKYIKSVG